MSQENAEVLKSFGVSDLKSEVDAIRSNSALVEAIQEGIDKANQTAVSRAAHVRKWNLLAGVLSLAGGELTPTMKLKRKAAYQKYRETIEKNVPRPKTLSYCLTYSLDYFFLFIFPYKQ